MSQKGEDIVPKLIVSKTPVYVIFQFIKPYDSTRENLNAFLIDYSNAIELVSASQESIVIKYIYKSIARPSKNCLLH